MSEVTRSKKHEAALLFRTLADPTRLRLLNLLACGETCGCELAETLRLVQPKVSRHLAHLRQAGLVEARRNGKWMHYQWSAHGDHLVLQLVMGFRDWMTKYKRMKGERIRRRRVCCKISRRKPRERKTR